MRPNYLIAVIAVAVLSAICLTGCDATADATASAEHQCETAARADASDGAGGTTCAAATEGCPGTCKSMKGTEVADAKIVTCAYHKDGEGSEADCTCPHGGDASKCGADCTCPAHAGADGEAKCYKAVLDSDGNTTCAHAVKDADGNVTCGCDHAAAEKTGTGKCPMSEEGAKVCPHASKQESS